MISNLNLAATTPANPAPSASERGGEAAKAKDAAQQFEALLLGQILRTVRENSGFGQSDTSGECATDFAEQQFAQLLAQRGGLGLARLISAGLERKAEHSLGESSAP